MKPGSNKLNHLKNFGRDGFDMHGNKIEKPLLGRPPVNNRKVVMGFSLSPQTLVKLEDTAYRLKVSRSQLVEKALQKYLETVKKA